MNSSQKKSWIRIVIWSIAFSIFLISFFIKGGANSFNQDSFRQGITAICIFLGFLFTLFFSKIINNKSLQINLDEMDQKISNQANQNTLVIVLVYIYSISILLFLLSKSDIPVQSSWFWFIAYSTPCIAILSQSISSITLYKKLD